MSAQPQPAQIYTSQAEQAFGVSAHPGSHQVSESIRQTIADIVRKLRPYQVTALRKCLERWKAGVHRQMLVLPTGTGKTVLFSTLPIYLGLKKRILVLVHRDTLAQQAVDKIKAWNPGDTVGIERGKFRCKGNERFVVASVQTLGRPVRNRAPNGKVVLEPNRRLLALNPNDFDAIIIDECHHVIASSYKRILRHFGFLTPNDNKTVPPPPRLLVGVTATPKRCDGARLDQIFDKKTYEYFIDEAIREGWLTNLRCWQIRSNSSLADVHTRGEDYIRDQLAKAVDTLRRNKLCVDYWQKLAAGRPTVCFAVDVQHTKNLTLHFTRRGIKAAGIWGDDPDKEQKLRDFNQGKILVLVNCELLTEGFDSSRVACVLLARPTASEALFKQMVGRGTRLEEGVKNLIDAIGAGQRVTKRDCLVLDIIDIKGECNTDEHNLAVNFAEAYGLPSGMDLDGSGLLQAFERIRTIKRHLKADDREAKIPPNRCQTIHDIEQLEMEVLQATAQEVDLFHVQFDEQVVRHSQLQWHKIGEESFVLALPYRQGYVKFYRNPEGFQVVETEGVEDPSKRFSVVGKIRNRSFGEGFAYADSKIDSVFGPSITEMMDRRATTTWANEPATSTQKSVLMGALGKDLRSLPPTLTKWEASMLITRIRAEREREARLKQDQTSSERAIDSAHGSSTEAQLELPGV